MSENHTGRTLREIVGILASRFVPMSVLVVVIVAAAALATIAAPKWYRCQVMLQAKPGIVNPLEDRPVSLREELSLFVVTQREIIMSDYVLASALMRLEGAPISKPPAGDDELMSPWYDDQQIADYIAANGKQLARVRDNIKVVTPGGPDATFTQVFTIRVDWPERPEKLSLGTTDSMKRAARQAQELTGYLVDAYLMRRTILESQWTSKAAQFLRRQSLATAREDLDDATRAMERFIAEDLQGELLEVISLAERSAVGAETGSASLTTEMRSKIDLLDAELAELRALNQVLTAHRDEVREKLAEARDKRSSGAKEYIADIVVPQAIADASPSFATLQEKIVSLKLELNSLRSKYQERYQEISNIITELAEVQEDLLGEMNKQCARLAQEINVLEGKRAALVEIMNRNRQRVDALAAKAAKYDRLRSDVEAAQTAYETQKEQVVRATTAQRLAERSILVAQLSGPGSVDPDNPRRPILWLNMTIAAIAALVIALVYAFMANHFDHTIKGAGDAERFLAVPVLASVPRLGRRIIRTRTR